MREGYVYFIHNPVSERVKIGFSEDVHRRFAQLQTGSSDELVLLGYVNGNRADEAKLHRGLKRYRIKGEWFLAEGHILLFVQRLIAKGAPITFFFESAEGAVIKQHNRIMRGWNAAGPEARQMFLDAIDAEISGGSE